MMSWGLGTPELHEVSDVSDLVLMGLYCIFPEVSIGHSPLAKGRRACYEFQGFLFSCCLAGRHQDHNVHKICTQLYVNQQDMMMLQQRLPFRPTHRSQCTPPRITRQVRCAATTMAVKLQSIPLTPEAFEPFGQVHDLGQSHRQ